MISKETLRWLATMLLLLGLLFAVTHANLCSCGPTAVQTQEVPDDPDDGED